MKIEQIATIMNAVNAEIIGVDGNGDPIAATVAEDGSGMLEAGKAVASWVSADITILSGLPARKMQKSKKVTASPLPAQSALSLTVTRRCRTSNLMHLR